MERPVELVIAAPDLTPEELGDIRVELAQWIGDTVPDCQISAPPPGPALEGAKGLELAAAGTLLLGLLNSGAAVAVVNCIATYVKERRRSVQIDIRDANGQPLSFRADNLGRDEVDRLTTRMGELILTARGHSLRDAG